MHWMNADTIAAMRRDLSEFNAQLADMDRIREQRDELSAFLDKWAPTDSTQPPRPQKPVPKPPMPQRPVPRSPEGSNGSTTYPMPASTTAAGAANKPAHLSILEPRLDSRTSRINETIAKWLRERVATRRSYFLNAYACLPAELRSDSKNDREYARTVIKRAGFRAGIGYDQDTATVYLLEDLNGSASSGVNAEPPARPSVLRGVQFGEVAERV